MEQRFILVGLFIALSFFTVAAWGSTNQHALEIELKKIESEGGQPRTPEQNPAFFSAYLLMNDITIEAENYSGEITVNIVGNQTQVNDTANISENNNVTINLSMLPRGVYTIHLHTSRGVFSGEFVW